MFKNFSIPAIVITLHFSTAIASAAPTTQTNIAPQLNNTQLAAAVDTLMHQQCDHDELSGAMLLASHGEVLFESSCGEASKRYHALNNVETKFNLASVGKMFTAVAIAQLVESHRMAYRDKISKYIDTSWLPASVTDRITIGQLLSHTSGLPEFLTLEKSRNSSRAMYRELGDFRPLLRGLEPSFQPGTRYSYSNTGFLLLGVAIEKASGENYYEYVRKHIYQVAGMTNSDSYALDDPVENLATGYLWNQADSQPRKESTFEGVLRGTSFCCGYSTVHDLLRFSEALKNNRLITQKSLQTLWQNHSPEDTPSGGRYGYGFELHSGVAGRVVGHSGQFPGVSANFDLYLDRDRVVIILSNYPPDRVMIGKVQDLIAQVPYDQALLQSPAQQSLGESNREHQ